jgi:hypothetical protein
MSTNDVPVHYLANTSQKGEAIQSFLDAEYIIIVFPLYTDCMPAIVKEFFERLNELGAHPDKKIGYIVQSGFPESIHSVYTERYLEKFTRRIKAGYLGTIIKGGVEGIQMMPERMTKKLFRNFSLLGKHFAAEGGFSPRLRKTLRTPYKMSAIRKSIFWLLSQTNLTNYYWNYHLKKNKAWGKRNDQPYNTDPFTPNTFAN